MQLPPLERIHHAYVVTGSPNASIGLIRTWLSDQGVGLINNPDIRHMVHDQLSIAAVRKLKSLQMQKNVAGKMFLLVEVDGITLEAQQALLKVLEEPTVDTYFFFCLPQSDRLLPTLLSRVHVVMGAESNEAILSVENFLQQAPKDRLDTLKKLLTKKKDTPAKLSRPAAIEFLNKVEEQLYQRWQRAGRKNNPKIFLEIRTMRDYLHDRGSSVKMVLEYVALVV